MKYYEIHYHNKSYCEYPPAWKVAYIACKDDEDFKKQCDEILRYAEYYDISTISEERYNEQKRK